MATETAQIDHPALAAKLSHLSPKSNKQQRIWYVGEGPHPTEGVDHTTLNLAVAPQCHESFASLKSILEQLKPLAQSIHLKDIHKVEGYLREACPDADRNGGAQTHGQLLADSVAFAIMRRISRESFYTARVIEVAARTINAILSSLAGCQQVHVNHLDQLDRPTLKVLARAMLLLKASDSFAWVWHSTCDPLQATPLETENIYLRSRLQLLRQLVGILSPTLVMQPVVAPLFPLSAIPLKTTTFDIAAALVVQNYDACFLWCDSLAAGSDAEAAEGHRLRALAAVNVDQHDAALYSLNLAEQLSASVVRQAHLSYLQGLIETKRRYDLSSSTSHYTRGLGLLDSCNKTKGEDPRLERAWLMNGLALNEAVLWRRYASKQEHYARAFALEREAFALVRSGDSPARTYLRFNLLANSAFLLEMAGNYDVAIRTLVRAFDFNLDETLDRKQVWRSTLGYRVGVLHYSAGSNDEALRLLSDAAESDLGDENWPTQERVLRALGAVLLHNSHYSRAADTFASGLRLCRAGRSAQGTIEHARNLIICLIRDGQKRRAGELCEELLSEEGLEIIPRELFAQSRSFEDLHPSPLSPKLPAYFPELDLEGIPSIDLNLFLGKREAAGNGKVSPWR
ncbi:MAG TPA: hypothetical protein VJ023_08145 [Pyrinomonadaceae bacterium]|nr:hypothetical protein [Pyrinomonadaceae bacterium]